MLLLLKVEVPASADPDLVLVELLKYSASREGITLVTPRKMHFDVDLVDVERVDLPSLREVSS